MSEQDTENNGKDKLHHAVEAAIRIGLIGVMVFVVFDIVKLFVGPMVWGAIIAVAGYPAFRWLLRRLGNRNMMTATVFTLLALILLITPMVWMTGSAVDWGQNFASEISDGKLEVPKPPVSVREWPLAGERIYEFWALAASNFQGALARAESQVKALGVWLLKSAAGAGLGVLQFILAIIIAGVLLANAAAASNLARLIATRVAPVTGARFTSLGEQTVRGVATGVVGVAIIQCVLAYIGFVAVDVPGAPVIAIVCLLVGIVQLPLSIPILPVVAYVWFKEPTLAATLFTIWVIPVALLDSFLKPILMGRGVEAPMLVVFMGAIGGMAANGIVGLFTGAVVLVVAYEIFRTWLEEPRIHGAEAPAGES